jgi:hypothetical protein
MPPISRGKLTLPDAFVLFYLPSSFQAWQPEDSLLVALFYVFQLAYDAVAAESGVRFGVRGGGRGGEREGGADEEWRGARAVRAASGGRRLAERAACRALAGRAAARGMAPAA